MGNKSIADARYSIVLSVDKPSYVFIALDERVLLAQDIERRHPPARR